MYVILNVTVASLFIQTADSPKLGVLHNYVPFGITTFPCVLLIVMIYPIFKEEHNLTLLLSS